MNLNYSERLFGVIMWGQLFITGLHCRACTAACVLQVLATLFLAQLHVNIWIGRKLWSNLCLKTGIAVNLVCMSSECLQSRGLLNLSGCSIPKNSPCECCHYSPDPIRLSLAVLVACPPAMYLCPLSTTRLDGWRLPWAPSYPLSQLKNTISTAFLHALAPNCASGPCWTPSGFSISLVFQWQNWA